MKVNELLKNKLTEDNANFGHADNEVTEQYWSPDEWVAFRDELGLLWMDHIDRDDPYVSHDDQHPDSDKPLIFNESTATWIGLNDERGEWYRLENENGECFVLCSKSIQYTPHERELAVVATLTETGHSSKDDRTAVGR